jgi:GNAT superfamily N-acetyltransferase
MTRRQEYFLNLSDFEHPGPSSVATHLKLRPALSGDSGALAKLMIEAYRGTIDDDGETIDDAIREVEGYLAGKHGGQPMLTESRLAFDGDHLAGACLTGEWQERQQPLIAYVMTHPAWKNRGVGKLVVAAVLEALREQGYGQVRAVISEGNIPSERLLGGMGFRPVSGASPGSG